jgi:hypothetical protein
MNSNYWYMLEITIENQREFEWYLNSLLKNLNTTPFVIHAFKSISTNNITVQYFIYEEVQYLFSIIKLKYWQIIMCKQPDMSDLVEVKINNM